jgi:hypothetical protein
MINLTGGLGNQLFQFANGINLALNSKSQIAFKYKKGRRQFNLSFLKIKTNQFYFVKIIDGQLEILPSTTCQHNLVKVKYDRYQEKSFTYYPIELTKKNSELFGYFQSPKYFASHNAEIMSYLKEKLSCFGENLDSELVVHIRLGDMATNPEARSFHGILREEYYLMAISEYFPEMKIVVVTEDLTQANEYYPNVTKLAKKFISGDPVFDLATMSRAKQLIVANSTLSLWGAYLAKSTIVVPKAWFTPKTLLNNPTDDLFLQGWIKL